MIWTGWHQPQGTGESSQKAGSLTSSAINPTNHGTSKCNLNTGTNCTYKPYENTAQLKLEV